MTAQSEAPWLDVMRSRLGLREAAGPVPCPRCNLHLRTHRWRGGSRIRRPSALEAPRNQASVPADAERCLLGGHDLVSDAHADGLPRVRLLLCLRGPVTVLWGIRAIVVAALQGSTFRTLAHIGHEVLEALAPAVADRDAAPAVPMEVWTSRIMAAAPHVDPETILGRLARAMCSDGGKTGRFTDDLSAASASRGRPASKVVREDITNGSTCAPAAHKAASVLDHRPVAITSGQRFSDFVCHLTTITNHHDVVKWSGGTHVGHSMA